MDANLGQPIVPPTNAMGHPAAMAPIVETALGDPGLATVKEREATDEPLLRPFRRQIVSRRNDQRKPSPTDET